MKSIRRHLVVWLLLWLSILCVIAVVAFVLVARKSLIADFDRSLSPELANARLLLRPGPLGFNNPENRGVTIFIQAWDSDTKNTLHKSENLGRRSLPYKMVRPRMTANLDAILQDGEPVRIAATGINTFASKENEKLGNPIIVAVAKNRSGLDARITRLTILASLIGGIGTIAAAGIAWLVLERGIRPLDRLGNRVDKIDPNSLETRLEIEGLADELEPFATRINVLLDRLEQGFERERRFSADLSHELRTPIAEIRSTAEFATLYPDRADPEDYQSILQTTERLQRIVEAQLALARIESDQLFEERESVNLVSTVKHLMEAHSPAFEWRGLKIRDRLPDKRIVDTNREGLSTILSNLFSNAADYAPKDSTITLSVAEEGPWITFSNSAPNLTQEDVPHLFERLWRKDASRTDGSHSGLGLSLARSCAEKLGLRLEATLSGGELTFSLFEIR
ncbi:MAG: ATP-binding protein [Verrucomicrobiales bacterium]|nr:ATP-binding protein [Verrucomicrobiales bacterium]